MRALVTLQVAADFSFGSTDQIPSRLLARRVGLERLGLACRPASSIHSGPWALGRRLGDALSAYLAFWAVFLLGDALFLAVAWFTSRFARADTTGRCVEFLLLFFLAPIVENAHSVR